MQVMYFRRDWWKHKLWNSRTFITQSPRSKCRRLARRNDDNPSRGSPTAFELFITVAAKSPMPIQRA